MCSCVLIEKIGETLLKDMQDLQDVQRMANLTIIIYLMEKTGEIML
jgi:hypothetical protein